MGEVLAAYAPQAQLRSSASHTSFFKPSYDNRARKKNASHSDLLTLASASSSQASSVKSTPDSSFSLLADSDEEDSEDEGLGLALPSYGASGRRKRYDDDVPPSSPITTNGPAVSPAEQTETNSTTASPPDVPLHSEDDTALKVEPSHHVDYLSYDWREEDIWSSWRHIVEHRKVYGERSRLENASWRTWAKNQFSLKTVPPETLNWSKDCDITWLYGPLQPASNRAISQNASEPTSQLSKTNSFLHKKPILKKRSMSEVMLQKSISASSLVKQAAAAVQAQQRAGGAVGTPLERRRTRPIINHAAPDFSTSIPSRTVSRDPTDYFSSRSTSGLQTPEQGERKHIRFDEKVEQCIAVDCKGGDDDDLEEDWACDDDSSDDGLIMMKRTRRKRPMGRSGSKSNMDPVETKIIEKLPSTTLKSREDSPDEPDRHPGHSLFGFYRSTRLAPSSSQETLRPSDPSSNFLLGEDDADQDETQWEPSGAFEGKRPGTPTPQTYRSQLSNADGESSGGLKRTSSGMFMPLEDDEEDPAQPGLIGKVVDTVNTAKDIAHVIWNVGWRS